MIRAIQPMTAAATYASRAGSNAHLLGQYSAFADSFYTPAPVAAAPTAGEQPARPLTRALPNLKSAGVFSYLRRSAKSANGAGAKSLAAEVRAPSVAAEPPPMASMRPRSDQVQAIHDDVPIEPFQAESMHRARVPEDGSAGTAKKMASRAAMLAPMASATVAGASKAIQERNRFVLTFMMGSDNSDDSYAGFNGRYAA